MKKNIVIVILLILVLGLAGYLGYDKFLNNKEIKQAKNEKIEEKTEKIAEEPIFTIPEGATKGNVETTDNINYSLNIGSYKANDVVYYSLNDKYTVSLKFYDISNYNYSESFKNFDISINGVLINIDSTAFDRKGTLAADENTIEMSLLGDYLIFNNFFWTDIRSTTIYAVSLKENKTTEIGEMEKIQGMVPSSKETVTKDGLIVKGSRLNHDQEIVYNGISYGMCKSDINNIPSDAIFSATYTYRYKDGKLDLSNPQKTDVLTVKDYLNKSENKSYCQTQVNN